MHIDDDNHCILDLNDEWVYLSPRLWLLFAFLYENSQKGKITRSSQLMAHIWPALEPTTGYGALRSEMALLRRAISGSCWAVINYRSFGYKLVQRQKEVPKETKYSENGTISNG